MSNKEPAPPGPSVPDLKGHAYPPGPHDLVAVEVVFAGGVKEDGKRYGDGQRLVVARAHAEAQNRAQGKLGRQVYRILKTVHYAAGPKDQAEPQEVTGPLDIS